MAGFFETMKKGMDRVMSPPKKHEEEMTKKMAPAGVDRKIEKEDTSKRRKSIDKKVEEAGG